MRCACAAVLVLVLAAPATPQPAPEAEARPKVISAWSQSLYLARRKIGYQAVGLYRHADGGYRIESNLFLKKDVDADQARYFKVIKADVDAGGRPRTLECQVSSGARTWRVEGRAEGDEMVLVRTVGHHEADPDAEGERTEARIPLEEDVTLRSWAVLDAVFGGVRPGQARRRRVIDESLGALLPDPCFVHVLGPRTIYTDARHTLTGTALVWVCGAERVAHLVDARGQVLRSVWHSSPLVAEIGAPAAAKELRPTADGPRAGVIDGLAADRYQNPALGYEVRVPPYPWAAHVASEIGLVQVTDLTDEADVTVRPAVDPRMAALDPALGGLAASSGEQRRQLAGLVQRQWAAQYDEASAKAPYAAALAGHEATVFDGTARLGCTRLHFRNYFVIGNGLAYLVSVRLADRPLSAEPALVETIASSLRLSVPQVRTPLEVAGDRLRMPYWGLELELPPAADDRPRWMLPARVDGPATVVDLVRADQAAAAVLRVLPARGYDSLEEFVTAQADRAGARLGIGRPTLEKTSLAGREAFQFDYEGGLLSGRPSHGRAVYAKLGEQVLSLVLVWADEPADARDDVERIRAGLRLAGGAGPAPPERSPAPGDLP